MVDVKEQARQFLNSKVGHKIYGPAHPMVETHAEFGEICYQAGLSGAARAICPTCDDSRFPKAEKFRNVWGHRCGENYVHCYAHAIWAIRALAQQGQPPALAHSAYLQGGMLVSGQQLANGPSENKMPTVRAAEIGGCGRAGSEEK